MMYDVIVVGGGLGGLFTAAFLARNGKKVLVLEKNSTAGGGLQSFSRNAVKYDTGMHVMGGWRRGATLDRFARYLGIIDDIELHHINDDCMDSIYIAGEDKEYHIPSGAENFVKALGDYFPDQRLNMQRYVDALYRIAESFDLFNLRPYSQSYGMQLDDEAMLAANEFIARYITNSRLQAVLSYINGLYDGRAGVTPAYIHALISVLYMGGASRFVGNSDQLVKALVKVISNAGGDLLCNHMVSSINISEADNSIESVACSNGAIFSGDSYVWAAHPDMLMRIIPRGTFSKAYKTRITTVPNSCSAFNIFIKLKPDTFPYIDHTYYIHDDMSDAWNRSALDDNGVPKGFMIMTPPVKSQDRYAHTMLVTALMDYDVVSRWEDSLWGERPADYSQWKQHVAQGVLDKIARRFPLIKESVECMHTASPLTIRDFYNAPRGAIYGFAKDCNNLLQSQMPIVTKVRNLYLAGQCVNLHGICGVPLTSLTTAEAILYPTTILPHL